jgi:hypothetical protein
VLPPGAMPRRGKGGSLASRQAMLHSLVHIGEGPPDPLPTHISAAPHLLAQTDYNHACSCLHCISCITAVIQEGLSRTQCRSTT